MGLVGSIIAWSAGILLVFYLILGEFLDNVGRLELIRERWPWLYKAVNTKPIRLFLLLFLCLLVAKDLGDRAKELNFPGLIVNMPATPAPHIEFKTVQPTRVTTKKTELEKHCWLSNAFGFPNSKIEGAVTATQAIVRCNYRIDAPFMVKVQFDRNFLRGAISLPDVGGFQFAGSGMQGHITYEQIDSPSLLANQLVIATVYGTTDQYPRAIAASIEPLQ